MISKVVIQGTRRNIARRNILYKILRGYSYVNFPLGDSTEPLKPTLSQFKNPLFHCFLIASTTYIVLHIVWINLSSSEKEAKFIEKTKVLEDRIQQLVDDRKNEYESKRKWSNVFKFWK
ncbi:uncharacterized protein AC631_04744 [Debaryomyces fabryi]|uniref:Uncharacterized protein n=1 Tax=Debaryomyces fabryi TaxID=58627 RepID=A0A0V1PTD7_9ASCO|nr:uncharacterized protein AC631_04744 [Debaryomyces fabryi]KRZ99493.1 hypothetical protein AC631_04744 [Debaryomyces fabryi]CUM54124.1 unnamed protein product [Debaryomyces fabryi]